MSVGRWFQQRSHRALVLISAQRRTHVALIIPSGDSAGLAKTFLDRTCSNGLPPNFRDRQPSTIGEHERGVVPPFVGSCSDPFQSNRTIGVPGVPARGNRMKIARTLARCRPPVPGNTLSPRSYEHVS